MLAGHPGLIQAHRSIDTCADQPVIRPEHSIVTTDMGGDTRSDLAGGLATRAAAWH